jgi:hypothetical protein
MSEVDREVEVLVARICQEVTCVTFFANLVGWGILYLLLTSAVPIRIIFYLLRRQRNVYFVELSMGWVVATLIPPCLYGLTVISRNDTNSMPIGKYTKYTLLRLRIKLIFIQQIGHCSAVDVTTNKFHMEPSFFSSSCSAQ